MKLTKTERAGLKQNIGALHEQIGELDVERNKLAYLASQFYQANYSPSNQQPRGWQSDAIQHQYYVLLRAAQELGAKKRAMLAALLSLKEQLDQSKDGLDLARERTRLREMQVTSSTYERAQKRLHKDVERWTGHRI